ncbi:MAG: hypothetical protein JWM90_2642 [Thermoleophilia bacterium]|nr:hypothetical protein [Thermoleophilia bacterium]
MKLRHLTLIASIAALFALPAAAQAGTAPVLNAPTPYSLQQSWPLFTWATGPAGEYVSSISVSRKGATDADGDLATTTGGSFLYPLKGLATTKTTGKLYSGQYFYNAEWVLDEPYERGYTPVQSFVIPTYLTKLAGTITQYSSITALSVDGSYITNAEKAVVTCRIYSGKRAIAKQVKFNTYASLTSKNRFYCSDMKVSERLDGKRLRLNVIVKAGGRTSVANKFFIAK